LLDAISELSKNPYSVAHDFKEKMLERLAYLVSSSDINSLKTIWELTFPGQAQKICSLDFLNRPKENKKILGFRQKNILPESIAKEYGIPAVSESNFVIQQMEEISKNQLAVLMSTDKISTPHWVVLDLSRENTLGIYVQDNRLIVDEDELSKIKFLSDEAKGTSATIKDFKTKIDNFSNLTLGKGDLAPIYKIKNQTFTPERIMLNDTEHVGGRLSLELSRKLLAKVIPGIPKLERVELILAPVKIDSLHLINGLQVIGHKIFYDTGAQMEIKLENIIP
jgi:hypothetical protein